jgi:hypothetical protein
VGGEPSYVSLVTTPGWLQLRKTGASNPAALVKLEGVRAAWGATNVKLLCELLGIKLVIEAFSYDGACRVTIEPGLCSATIFIDKSGSPQRQRFTIAHEIAHVLRHKAGVLYKDISVGLSRGLIEDDANEFAAALLMPNDEVRESIGLIATDGKSSHWIADMMARRYDVSLSVAQERLDKVYHGTSGW